MSSNNRPITLAIWERLSGEICQTIKQVADQLDVRIRALEAAKPQDLEARVRALEQRPAMDYRGTWAEGTVYGSGSLVTHGGSMWIALSASVSRRPGTDPGAWRLIVKRGADGRDGKDLR